MIFILFSVFIFLGVVCFLIGAPLAIVAFYEKRFVKSSIILISGCFICFVVGFWLYRNEIEPILNLVGE